MHLIVDKKWVDKWMEGNILHCTKRAQNKTKMDEWRLLKENCIWDKNNGSKIIVSAERMCN